MTRPGDEPAPRGEDRKPQPGEGEKTSTMPGAGEGPPPEPEHVPDDPPVLAGLMPDPDPPPKPQRSEDSEPSETQGAHNPKSDLRSPMDHQADAGIPSHQAR